MNSVKLTFLFIVKTGDSIIFVWMMDQLFLHSIILFSALQGFILGIFLLIKRKNTLINLPIGLLILFISIELTAYYLMITGKGNAFLFLIFFCEPLIMVYGPLVYMYVRNSVNSKAIIRKSDIAFFIPFIIYLIDNISSYYSPYRLDTYDSFYLGTKNMGIWGYRWEWLFEIAFNISFLVFAIRLITNYKKQLKEVYSNIEKMTLRFIRYMVYIGISIYFLELLIVLFTFGNPYFSTLYLYFNLCLIVTMYIIGYYSLINRRLIAILIQFNDDQQILENKKKKYQKTAITESVSTDIRSLLLKVMKEERPYLNPELHLKDLADLIGFPPHLVSQVINDSFNQNFYEFINEYRVREAKRLLETNKAEKFSCIGIGYEVGFNSKSAFYTSFKKHTGFTPGNYRKYE